MNVKLNHNNFSSYYLSNDIWTKNQNWNFSWSSRAVQNWGKRWRYLRLFTSMHNARKRIGKWLKIKRILLKPNIHLSFLLSFGSFSKAESRWHDKCHGSCWLLFQKHARLGTQNLTQLCHWGCKKMQRRRYVLVHVTERIIQKINQTKYSFPTNNVEHILTIDISILAFQWKHLTRTSVQASSTMQRV